MTAMQPKTVVLAAILLPFFALHISYLVAAASEVVPWCFPYIEGCTSISRTARKPDAIFVFRALMLPYAVVLIAYWRLAYIWLRQLGDIESLRPRLMMICGILGGLFLIVYVDFLGTHGRGYELMRRYGVIFFFGFTGLAQFLQVSRLYQLDDACRKFRLCGVRLFQLIICFGMLLLGLMNVTVSALMEDHDAPECAIEWNFGLLLYLFAIGTYVAWKRTSFDINYQIRSY